MFYACRAILILFLLSSSYVLAQNHPLLFQAQVGIAIPYDIVEFAYVPGVNLGLGIGSRISGRWAIIASFDASVFLADREKISAENKEVWDGLRTKVDYRGKIATATFGGAAHLRYTFNPDPIAASVYLIGGPSAFYLLRQKMTISGSYGSRILPERGETSFGFATGAGLEIPVYRNSIALTVEARFSAAVTGRRTGFTPWQMMYRIGLNF